MPKGCPCLAWIPKGSSRMAVHHRRRGGTPPGAPPPPFPRPKGPSREKTKFTIGKILSGHFFGHKILGPIPPPRPPLVTPPPPSPPCNTLPLSPQPCTGSVYARGPRSTVVFLTARVVLRTTHAALCRRQPRNLRTARGALPIWPPTQSLVICGCTKLWPQTQRLLCPTPPSADRTPRAMCRVRTARRCHGTRGPLLIRSQAPGHSSLEGRDSGSGSGAQVHCPTSPPIVLPCGLWPTVHSTKTVFDLQSLYQNSKTNTGTGTRAAAREAQCNTRQTSQRPQSRAHRQGTALMAHQRPLRRGAQDRALPHGPTKGHTRGPAASTLRHAEAVAGGTKSPLRHGGGGGGAGLWRMFFGEGPPPPPQTKVTIVGKHDIYKRDLVGPCLVHKFLGPRLPAPNTPLKHSPRGGGGGLPRSGDRDLLLPRGGGVRTDFVGGGLHVIDPSPSL